MQRRHVLGWVIVAWVLPLFWGVSALAQEREFRTPPESYGMPEVLYSSDPNVEYPQWVSIGAAYVEPGQLNSAYFSRFDLAALQRRWSAELENGCLRLTAFYYSDLDVPNQGTLLETIESSNFILHGRVTGRSFGFQGKEPGQLLRVEPIEILKSGAKALTEYFVFYPAGTFVMDGYPICKSDSRYARLPDLGDEVFLFATERYYPQLADAFVHLGKPFGFASYSESVGLSLAFRFRQQQIPRSAGGPVESKEDLIQLVRRNVEEP